MPATDRLDRGPVDLVRVRGRDPQEPVFVFVRSPVGDALVDVASTTQHRTAAP